MQDASDEIRIQLLNNRINAAIKFLEKEKTEHDVPKSFYDLDSKKALHILKGLCDTEFNLSPDPNDFI
jgi:hypothetical protein